LEYIILSISLYLIKKKKRSKRIKKYIKEKYIKRKDITKYILYFIFYLWFLKIFWFMKDGIKGKKGE